MEDEIGICGLPITGKPENKQESQRFEFKTPVSKELIIEAIKYGLGSTPLIKPTPTLVNTVYAVLSAYLIDGKKIVVLKAPTGSGKTIIGFVVQFSMEYIAREQSKTDNIDLPKTFGYFLTSNKMLQEQIANDINRFEYEDSHILLKGGNNYECTNNGQSTDGSLTYDVRPCKGLTGDQIRMQYSNCFESCAYRCARTEAAEKRFTVMNYHYFLNVMRSFSPFFGTRTLTVADEAHLIPEIICSIFNSEFTRYTNNRVRNMLNEIQMNFGSTAIMDDIAILNTRCESIFLNYSLSIDALERYCIDMIELGKLMADWSKVRQYKPLQQLNENIESYVQSHYQVLELLKRPKDIHIETEKIDALNGGKPFYKHTVRDLCEHDMSKRNFLDKTDYLLLMTAMGNTYAGMLGLSENDYEYIALPSSFDFSKSPIYLANVGYLNAANIAANLDNALLWTYNRATKHRNEKGLIHTVTNKINSQFRELVSRYPDKDRYLFYSDAAEKEAMVNLLKTSTKPYILCGPSLYEGLDLPDDNGRIQIFVKAPYDGLSDYTKAKMQRYPNWYKNNVLNKIEQGVGRTNRHVNDYSTIYLVDTSFAKLIYETDKIIWSRVKPL